MFSPDELGAWAGPIVAALPNWVVPTSLSSKKPESTSLATSSPTYKENNAVTLLD